MRETGEVLFQNKAQRHQKRSCAERTVDRIVKSARRFPSSRLFLCGCAGHAAAYRGGRETALDNR